tara:strand:- start:504 stop:839 length:336 start_codon:yes stop_codon:yes gene_type:complete
MKDNMTVLSLSNIKVDSPENTKIKGLKFENCNKKISIMSDGKRDKFKKLAESRVNTVIKNLKLIGNLSNKSNYEYNENDLKKINSAISREFKTMKERFNSGGKRAAKRFKL